MFWHVLIKYVQNHPLRSIVRGILRKRREIWDYLEKAKKIS